MFCVCLCVRMYVHMYGKAIFILNPRKLNMNHDHGTISSEIEFILYVQYVQVYWQPENSQPSSSALWEFCSNETCWIAWHTVQSLSA